MEQKRYRMKFDRIDMENPWRGFESFCTTGQFQYVDGRHYLRHCGPTAVTNLILTLKMRELSQDFRDCSTQEQVFLQMAKIGERMGIYYNTDFWGKFGGTSDLLVIAYIAAALKACHSPAKILGCHLLTEKNVRSALKRGSLLYIALHHHPKYHNHHLLCYGGQDVMIDPSEMPKRKRYFYHRKLTRNVVYLMRCADGWSRRPEYLSLPASCGVFIEIGL